MLTVYAVASVRFGLQRGGLVNKQHEMKLLNNPAANVCELS